MESPITKENEKYYLKDISLDIEYFGWSYKKAKIQKNIDGKNAFQVADELRNLLDVFIEHSIWRNATVDKLNWSVAKNYII